MASFLKILSKIPGILPEQETYVVGGAVRDRILGRPITDVDLLLEKNPAQWGMILAEKLEGTAFPLDIERGITRITIPGNLHLDLAKRQGPSLEADLDRRDFTANALAVPLADWLKPRWKNSVIDRQGGRKDLEKKIIRAVSNNIYKDDPLRLLRTFRIAAELGFSIPNQTLNLVRKNKARLKDSAPERIREEILKILSTPESYPYFLLMEKTGLLGVFYPETQKLKKIAPQYYGRGGVLTHTLEGLAHFESIQKDISNWFPKHSAKIKEYLSELSGDYPRFAQLKWALLLHDIGKAKTGKIIDGRLRFFDHEHRGAKLVEKLAGRYRWSNSESSSFARLIRNHMRPGNLATHPQVSDKAIHRFFRDLEGDAVGMLLVSLADHLTYLTPRQIKKHSSPHELVTRLMINRYYSHREKVLPPKILNGHDIMKEFGLEPSPLIGELLQKVTDAQAEGRIKTKEDGLAYLKTVVKP